MKFGDKVVVRDGSQVDGNVGVVYRVEEENILVLLEKEVIWPVVRHSLELVSDITE